MTWWVPFPYDFLADPRVKVLSLAARGVLASLIVQARGGATLPFVNHHDAYGTVAVVALREGAPADARAAVGTEVQALVEAGLLTWDEEQRELHLHLAATSPPQGQRAAPAPTRTKPSDDRTRTTVRASRHYFERRQRQWKHVPEGTTWEQWLASDEGRSWSERQGLTTPSTTPATSATPATPPGNALGNAPATPPGNAPATPPPSRTLPPQKDREKETDTQNGNAPATPPPATRNAPPATRALQGALPPEGERCPTVEAGPRVLDPDAVVAALRARVKRRLTVAHDSRTLADLGRLVTELAARAVEPVGLGAYEVLGDWIGAGGLGWWSQGTPSLAYLLKPGALARHLEEASRWHEAGRPPIRHRRPDRFGPLPPAPPETWKGATGKAVDPFAEDPSLELLVRHHP